jgi:fibronectin-binding autotransporter adhesin
MKPKSNTFHHLGFIALAFAGFAASSAYADTALTTGQTIIDTTGNPALGVISRSTGATALFNNNGVATATGTPLVNGILGPWASIGTGTATRYATLDGSNNVVSFTGTATTWAGAVNSATANYEISTAGTATYGGSERLANTIRYTGGAGSVISLGNTSIFGLTVNGLTNAGTGAITFQHGGGALAASGIHIGATQELVLNAANADITVNARVHNNTGGASAVTVVGPNTVTLSAANTYTGPTTISAGRLNVISPGSIDTSAVALGAATLGGNGSVGAVTANNVGSIITNGNGNTNTLNLASLAFSASGTMNLNLASDTFTPAVAVTNTLDIGTGFTVNLTTAPSWTTGQTYNLINYGTLSGTFSNIIKGTISGLAARQIATLDNTGSTNGSITLAITGDTPVWTGIQSNAWTTAIISGSKNWKLLDSGEATDFVSNDQVLFDDSATGTTNVDISTANVQVASVVFDNWGVDNSGFDYTISSSGGFGIADGSSSASLVKNGAGTVTLKTINSYTGATSINAGTLQLGDGTTDGDIASSSSIVNNGTLILNRSTGSFSYGNVISGFGDIVKNGAGTQILSGDNTFSGVTTINAGTIQVGNGGTTGSLGTSSVTNDASLVLNRSNGFTVSGVISGTGSVSQIGTGAVTFTNANPYTGGTTVDGGTLQVGNSTTAAASGSTTGLGAAGSTVTVNVGTLRFQMGANSSNAFDQNFVFNANSTLSSYDGRLTFGSDTAATASNSRTITINGSTTWNPLWSTKQFIMAGVVQGSGDINIVRPSTNLETGYVLFLNDTNTYSGTITTSGAIGTQAAGIMVGTTNTLQNANIVNNTLNSTSSASGLIFQATSAKLGSLAGTGNFILGQNTSALTIAPNQTTSSTAVALTVGGSNASTTYSGRMSGLGSITKAGTGTMTLTGANTYTGDTTVNAGVLAVNGDAVPNANKLVINGGKVNPLGATEVVNTLYFGATQQASGTWGATGSGAAHIDDTHFSGTGVVSVTTGPAGSYTTWADANGANGQTVDQDHDNDGTDNGIEYFMGQTGSSFTSNPAAVSGAVTWPMGATYTGVYGTDYEVQSSTDLVIWTQVPIGTGDNTVAVTAGTSVVYDMPAGGKSFVRLVVRN